MAEPSGYDRRRFLEVAAVALAPALARRREDVVSAGSVASGWAPPVRQVKAGVLDIGYFELGSPTGPAVLLLHGFPYSVESYAQVAPLLAARGCRVIVPHLRGHGSTRFLDDATSRSGQQGALGVDVLALMDALWLERAVLAGYDWGGRAACVAAALWPARCAGLVSVNGYLIQDIARAGQPLLPSIEAGLWYQFYFLTDRGRAGLAAHRRELARTLWRRNSPTWHFDEATLARHAAAFDHPDYVDVVVHSYRHRLGHVAGDPTYAEVERRLAALPPITVPTITLDGAADGVVSATDGTAAAARFARERRHRVLTGAGHNLPEEAPADFASAVWDLASVAR